jgi:hypothetical protein
MLSESILLLSSKLLIGHQKGPKGGDKHEDKLEDVHECLKELHCGIFGPQEVEDSQSDEWKAEANEEAKQ